MEKVPMNLAKIIWPIDTELCMEQFFNKIFTAPKEYMYRLQHKGNFSYEDVDPTLTMMNSWLYRQIDQWRKDKTYAISDETKTVMFNFALGV
jgi:hypothetical protein